MKKRLVNVLSLFLLTLILFVMIGTITNTVNASSTPYYTFTTDNDQGFILTSDAYTPAGQILDADGDTFKVLEYVYVDHEDYVYITDSGLSKVFIYDNNMNFVDVIEFFGNDEIGGLNTVNSVYVTEDKIYVPDSFRKAIFIFDREASLNRTQQYNIWLDDVDDSDDMSTGDLVYENDITTGEPIGTPKYEINVTGQTDTGKDIYDFLDPVTREIQFTKADRDDIIGKIFNWVEADYNGKTLLQHTVKAQTNEPIDIITTPDHPVFIGDPENPTDGYTFAPKKVVVDTRGNMYIVGAQSDSGLIMLSAEGEFINFFGGNSLRTPLVDFIRSLMFTDGQKEKLREESQIYIDYISGVAIDEKGFVYTVTSTLEDNIIKKFNVSGVNYFSDEARGWVGAVDLWVGNYGNVIVVNEDGWITEYNANGELVFTFSVNDSGINREGLLSLPQSIAADSKDNLYVVDQGSKLLQIYSPTEFTNAVHGAFQAYQDGDEDLAQERWSYSLEYATVFDMAHEGLGDAYVRQENYEAALAEYRLASYNEGISNTFWQVRQAWLEDNLETLFIAFMIALLVRFIFKQVDKRLLFTKPLKEKWAKTKKENQLIRELSYIKYFLQHPLDGFYEIKRHNVVGMKTASIIYVLLAALYVFYQKATNIIFISDPNANVLYELIILISIMTLWIVANYFVCLVREGEGSFKNVFVATAMTLTPFLIVVPFLVIISNVLTYQEAVFFNIPFSITAIWVLIYFFFMIKEIHNYEVGETFGIIGISMFTMLIMGIFIFVVYSINTQIFTVTEEIARELIQR